MSKLFVGVCAAVCAVAVIAAPSASAQPHMMVGLLDQASTFYYPNTAFPILKKLRVQVLRSDLYWGGSPYAVAKDSLMACIVMLTAISSMPTTRI